MKISVVIVAIFLGRLALADGAPAGFEDPKLLAQVLSGKVVVEDKVSTNVEFVSIGKAFFKGASPEAYSKLAIDYKLYPKMFEEVVEGKAIKNNAEMTELDFMLHMVVSVGPFQQDVYPEGHHNVMYPKDAISEGLIKMKITNYTEYIKDATQSTRLIPYQGGILVEDTVHVLLQNPSAQAGLVKKKLKEFYNKYITNLRKELKAVP